MKKQPKWKKWALGTLFVMLVLAIEFFLISPFFLKDDNIAAVIQKDAPESACARVVSVLETQLKKIGDSGEASDYLERAKILNRLSLEACGEEGRS
ncbi:MAG: hypothetical protein LBB08_00280, partial [Rickettsiales bacterium]|nr:hypothetical protein [Rickettsiales bacterium]